MYRAQVAKVNLEITSNAEKISREKFGKKDLYREEYKLNILNFCNTTQLFTILLEDS